MQEKTIADAGRKFNTMKNKALAVELKKYLDGKYEDTSCNRDAFRKMLSVIAGRLNTL